MHGFHTKNLFLRDKKKKNYLVIAHEDSLIDLTLLTERIRSSRLSFGSKERLFEELGVFPGAVTPLSVVNNKKKGYKYLSRCRYVWKRHNFLSSTCK